LHWLGVWRRHAGDAQGAVAALSGLLDIRPVRFGSMMGERRIVRSSYGGARPRRDFPWLARLYLDGRLKLDELITQRLPLERIDEGFDAMRLGRTLRTVLEIAH
jgi:Zn-dependent alcohol dehydrogenase